MTRDELQRVIDVIVEELSSGRGQPRVACACHSVQIDCCPDRLRGVLDAGATRVGLHAAGGAPEGVASMIDHTLLKPDASRKMTNLLAVDVKKDTVRFLVNGTEVASLPAAKVDTTGIAGLRINHNLNVQVDGFQVKAAETRYAAYLPSLAHRDDLNYLFQECFGELTVGHLYVTGGDGASFNQVDYGQLGGTTNPIVTPRNVCGDPPGGVGGSMTPPTAEGGALRSQSRQRAAGGPVRAPVC